MEKQQTIEDKKNVENSQNFESLINEKIIEIENILFSNLADKENIANIHQKVSSAVSLPYEKDILASINQTLAEVKTLYDEHKKNNKEKLTEDAKHFLTDIENDRIPSLHSAKLKEIAKTNGITYENTAISIIQKLQELRDGVSQKEISKDQNTEKKPDETTQLTGKNDQVKELRKQRALLRGEILVEKMRTPEGFGESKKTKEMISKLLTLEKETREMEKTEQASIIKKKEIKKEDLNISKEETGKTSIVNKNEVKKEDLKIPKKETEKDVKSDGFFKIHFPKLWGYTKEKEQTEEKSDILPLVEALEEKKLPNVPRGVLQTKQEKTIPNHPPHPNQTPINELIKIPKEEKENVITTDTVPTEKSNKQEDVFQNLCAPYIIKEGDTIRKILEIRLVENKKFKNLAPRQKNFILDSMIDTFKKSKIFLRPGETLSIENIVKESKNINILTKSTD